ncbi:hypothetical protein PPL_05909 [Heterostelium album PN500]|uniref:E3 ubiquitin-protein ligase CHFR n=1 Tax=Heterostelium pallidum (strain ATCC 26659 / Pp 5 / PN500) TaxID=670386 RepID=D3BBP0_HETP5|nr:hypothetical protein PPL_05909 [Heterostelium album PN500]EFA81073.1 hypothetical protein PPL_05909 [Heterostelium album PN500]|eukprot:XP_020433191.1 hypothetical protein PPL_05909 [Heterostelium album PN500]
MDSDLDRTFTSNGGDTSLADIDQIMTSESKWARLASENPAFAHIELEVDECTFGRARTCNIKHDDKRISSNHCRLYRKREPGETDYRFYLEDTRKKIGKGNTVSIVHGNEIALTTNIDPDDEKRLVYTFQDWDKIRRDRAEELRKQAEEERLRLEAEERDRLADEPGNTQVLDESATDMVSPIKSDKTDISANDDSMDMTTATTPSKLTKNGTELVLDTSSTTTDNNTPDTPTKRSSSNNSNVTPTKNGSKSSISPAGSFNNNDTTTTTTTTTGTAAATTTTPDQTKPTTTTLTTQSSTVKRKSSDLSSDNNNNNNNSNTDSTKKTKIEHDSMEDNLICGICQEIIHKCLTLIPCMHNFCMCCYGDWRANSSICPQCRSSVKSGQKNHAINNLIESYLKVNPSKKRDADELKEMDDRCKITEEMLQKGVLNKIKNNEYYDDDDDEEDYDNEDDYDDDEDNYHAPGLFNQHLAFNKCYFCTNPTPDGFKCPDQNAAHQYCAGCSARFPLRVPPPYKDKCDLCSKPYCDNVRACPMTNISKVNNLVNQHINDIPHNSLSGNQYEIKIVTDYLAKHNKTVDQLYHEVLADIDSGKIPADTIKTLNATPAKSDSWACNVCTRHVFAQGLFTYRKNIPKADLPDYAQARDNCYYGKNCRTQFNKFDHAKKLNHVCEQSSSILIEGAGVQPHFDH